MSEAAAQMKELGIFEGKHFWFAEPGIFTRPGVYYWDGKTNVHLNDVITAAAPATPLPENTGDPDMPNLSLCSFQYLADEMKRRGATVTPVPHGGDFSDDPATPLPTVEEAINKLAAERGIKDCCGLYVMSGHPEEPPECCGSQETFVPLDAILTLFHSATPVDRDAVLEEAAKINLTDPLLIIAGIKQFGLAPDGSDLRDLTAAISRLRNGGAA